MKFEIRLGFLGIRSEACSMDLLGLEQVERGDEVLPKGVTSFDVETVGRRPERSFPSL